ncbi:hypothetical protein [Paraliobacillus ryukyuensis]|uniref:hypothetical protein n=1 Tax=Paraliobacillus ryukyuensis TaxID=200904 RepID=UPI0009A75F44|nr:hypothetical protein [Paraliobacillus ryukyuensis]
MNKEIENYIVLPFVLNIFKCDRETMQQSKVLLVYNDLFDTSLEKLQQDMINNQKFIHSKLRATIKRIKQNDSLVKYSVEYKSGEIEILEFEPSELKKMTELKMKYYLAQADVSPKNEPYIP